MFFGQSMLGDATFGSIFDDYANTINDWSNPTYSPPSSGGGLDWQRLIEQWTAVGSQAIGAWGRNQTQQVGVPGIIGIGQGYSPASTLQAQAQNSAAIAAALAAGRNNAGDNQPGGSNSLDGIFASFTRTVSQNPMIFLGLGVGAYLLFREPPRSRR